MIAIINYYMGNLGSIKNMINKLGFYDVEFVNDKNKLKEAEKIILPGVGAFDKAIENLQKLDLIEVLQKKVNKDGVYILGICLGMQIMTKSSQEGKLNGLGWIDARTLRFSFRDNSFKIPHMGWNTVEIKKESKLFYGMYNQENRFYFVHSYYVECNRKEDILTTTNYSIDFVSSYEKDNIIAVQFHPEKSHRFGMQIFRNFIERY